MSPELPRTSTIDPKVAEDVGGAPAPSPFGYASPHDPVSAFASPAPAAFSLAPSPSPFGFAGLSAGSPSPFESLNPTPFSFGIRADVPSFGNAKQNSLLSAAFEASSPRQPPFGAASSASFPCGSKPCNKVGARLSYSTENTTTQGEETSGGNLQVTQTEDTEVIQTNEEPKSPVEEDKETDLPCKDGGCREVEGVSFPPGPPEVRTTGDSEVRSAGIAPFRDSIASDEDSEMVSVAGDDEKEEQDRLGTEVTDQGNAETMLQDIPVERIEGTDLHLLGNKEEVATMIDGSTEVNLGEDKDLAAEITTSKQPEQASVTTKCVCNESEAAKGIEPGTSQNSMQGEHYVCGQGTDSDKKHDSGAFDVSDEMVTSEREDPASNKTLLDVKPHLENETAPPRNHNEEWQESNAEGQAGSQASSDGMRGDEAMQHGRPSRGEPPALSGKPGHEVKGSNEINKNAMEEDVAKGTNGFAPLLQAFPQTVHNEPTWKEDATKNIHEENSSPEAATDESIAASTETGRNQGADATRPLTCEPATFHTLIKSTAVPHKSVAAPPDETADLSLSTPRPQRRTKLTKEKEDDASISKNRIVKTALAVLVGIGAAACTHISQS